MEEVKRVLEVYRFLTQIYKEEGIIDEVKYKYELNVDESLKQIYLYVTITDTDKLISLVEDDDVGDQSVYEGIFEDKLWCFGDILQVSLANKLIIMVEGSGNTKFQPYDMKDINED